ncbi:MAG: hypothetical protein WCG47_28425, partial [Dermatophilaceae bacterium]
AYSNLQIAAHGDPTARAALGPINLLERPWDPPTCRPATRTHLWAWLDDVAAWINHEYAWGVDRLIPPCWPQHPHLVHELAVLADQRRHAGTELSSDALEIWHRDTLPLFLDRTRGRLAEGCATSHSPCPAAGRHRAYHAAADNRQRAYHHDTTTQEDPHLVDQQATARLALVDLGTGQLINATPSDGMGP